MIQRQQITIFFIFLYLTISLVPSVSSAEIEKGERLKAHFILKFPGYIRWPQIASASDKPNLKSNPIRILLLGNHPFGNYLSMLAKRSHIKGRAIEITEVTYSSQLSSIEKRPMILFVAADQRTHIKEIQNFCTAKGILIISASKGWAQKLSHINFYEDGDYIRFEIAIDRVKQSGFHFHAKLLKLAKIIHKRER